MYKFVKADKIEFAKNYVVYQMNKYPLWMPMNTIDAINLYAGFNEDAYWIEIDGKRIGGLLLEPNWLGFLFLIPPYEEQYKVIEEVVNYLRIISNKEKPIRVDFVVDEFLPHFYQLGFQLIETQKEMTAATRPFDVNFSDDIIVTPPKKEELKEMIDLYYEVFKESKVKSIASKKYEFYESLLKDQIDEIDMDYSTVLKDRNTNEIVGITTVQIWQGLPNILDVLVKSSHQGKGLGQMMVKRILNKAYEKYPAVCLTVVSGNPAEKLYYKLGFIGSTPSHAMIMY